MTKLIAISDLLEHEQQEALYGPTQADEKLVNSIARIGVTHPPLVSERVRDDGSLHYVIISGHRRVSACAELGYDAVACDVRRFTSTLEETATLIECNATSRDKSKAVKAREVKELAGVLTAMAQQRRAAALAGEEVPEEEKGETPALIAGKLGISAWQAKKILAIVGRDQRDNYAAKARTAWLNSTSDGEVATQGYKCVDDGLRDWEELEQAFTSESGGISISEAEKRLKHIKASMMPPRKDDAPDNAPAQPAPGFKRLTQDHQGNVYGFRENGENLGPAVYLAEHDCILTCPWDLIKSWAVSNLDKAASWQ